MVLLTDDSNMKYTFYTIIQEINFIGLASFFILENN